jgi:hypothetical protein
MVERINYLSRKNCAFGLYPSSVVSRTNKIEELKIIDKRSQYTIRSILIHLRQNPTRFE